MKTTLLLSLVGLGLSLGVTGCAGDKEPSPTTHTTTTTSSMESHRVVAPASTSTTTVVQ